MELILDVLSSEQREQYQHLVPRIISVAEYYRLESNIERIKESTEPIHPLKQKIKHTFYLK